MTKPIIPARVQLPELNLPPPPYVTRDGATPVLTDAGINIVEMMARELYTQEEIASTLGLSTKAFRNLLGKADDHIAGSDAGAHEDPDEDGRPAEMRRHPSRDGDDVAAGRVSVR